MTSGVGDVDESSCECKVEEHAKEGEEGDASEAADQEERKNRVQDSST